MTTYVPLGSRQVTGVADTTGNNHGNWSVVFDPATINVNVPYFEVAHIVLNGAPGSTFSISIDAQVWDSNENGYKNSWDPSVPLPLRPGQYLYFYWSNPSTDGNPPTVTIWMRYDQDIQNNILTAGGKILWVGTRRKARTFPC